MPEITLGTRLKVAGRQLVKANIGNAVKALTLPQPMFIDSATHGNAPGKWFFDGLGGLEFNFTYSGLASCVKAYTDCGPVASIINKKTQAYINGKTWLMNTKGKEATGAVADRIKKLLARPNPYQTWAQFEAQGYIYQQLFGYNVVLPIKPVGFDNTYAKAMYNICPAWLDIEEYNKPLFYQDGQSMLKRIKWTYDGVSQDLSIQDYFIIRDITPSFCTQYLPESRLKPVAMQINNIIGAYESRNTLINYRGAQGFLTPDKDPLGAIPLQGEEKEDLQRDFMRYGLRHKQWQVIISNAQLKWNQMGYATKDLMLFEEIQDDIERLCDQFNWPMELISSKEGVTFANKGEAKTLAYQDATIPEADLTYSQWNIFFDTDKYQMRLEKDYSHVPALQGDAQKKAQARKTQNEALQIEFLCDLITRNRWRELIGEDTIPGDDLFYSQLVAQDKIIPIKPTNTGNDNFYNNQNGNSNAAA